jgi:hypothetical protein
VKTAKQDYPLFALFEALRGPDLTRVKFTPTPKVPGTMLPPPQPGTVAMRIDPDVDSFDDTLPDLFKERGATLADLIDTDQVLPGTFTQYDQNLILDTRTIGTGGGYGTPGTRPTGRPAQAPLRLVLGCRRGKLRARLVGSALGRVRRAAIYGERRRGLPERRRPYFRAIPRSYFRGKVWGVRAVVRFKDGRRLTLRRSARSCRAARRR